MVNKSLSILYSCILVFFVCGHLEAINSRPLVIILLGAPASGKGTQAAFLKEKLQIPALSTGELLRENRNNKTKLGLEAEQYIDKGQLVPDEMILGMLFERLNEKDTQKGYILDGFPRTLGQAEAYSAKVGSSVELLVINIDAPDSLLFERIKGRAQKEQRSDDTPAILEERLKNYRLQTAPLVEYYRSQHLLYQINGAEDAAKISSQIMAIIQDKQRALAASSP